MTIENSALELVGNVYGLLEIEEFRPGLLAALRRAVPADWVSLNEVGPDPTDTGCPAEPTQPCSGSYTSTGPLSVATAPDGSIWFTVDVDVDHAASRRDRRPRGNRRHGQSRGNPRQR